MSHDDKETIEIDPLDSFNELRAILLSDERKAISEINAYLVNYQQRRLDVANVLPEAIREANRSQSTALIESIREPVMESIAVMARRDREDLSNAMAPVIGPAIIRSVSETLTRYIESIETIASHNLTLRGVKWRLEALRSGVPFSKIVLKYTLLYRIEQVFLIHKSSGLLIAHAKFLDQPETNDKDAIAGMVSAIHSFARDSLLTENVDSLEAVDLGGHQLRLLQGSHAMLACVIQGNVPKKVIENAKLVLDEIHRKYHYELKNFNGDTYILADTQRFLEPLLVESKPNISKGTGNNRSKKRLRLLIAIIVGCLVAGFYISNWLERQEIERISAAKLLAEQQAKQALQKDYERLVSAFDKIPGLLVTRIDRVERKWLIVGLLDPLGLTTQQIAMSTGISQEQLQFKLRPYLSLDSELLLKRAKAVLASPAGINISIIDSNLIIKGEATQEWLEAARYHARVHLPPYFNQIDLSGVVTSTTRMKKRAKK